MLLYKIVVKGRERLNREPLKNFKDLPEDKQENFIKIKKILNEYFNKNNDVFVFGSFKHGYWDEFSDYDVIIYENCNTKYLDDLISKKLDLKVNVKYFEKKVGEVLIP